MSITNVVRRGWPYHQIKDQPDFFDISDKAEELQAIRISNIRNALYMKLKRDAAISRRYKAIRSIEVATTPPIVKFRDVAHEIEALILRKEGGDE